MHRAQSPIFRLAVMCAVLVGLAACRELSPMEKLIKIRSGYTAELNGFVVRQELEEETGELEEAAEELRADSAGEEAADVEAEGAEAAVPVTNDVILDILVRTESTEKLPGITIDISHADPRRQEKNHWLVWLDTSEVERGPGTQFTHVLEGISYEEGDGFFVEVRQSIPPEEQDQYREFADLP